MIERVTRDHVEVLGGDRNRDVLLGHNELLHTFGALRVLRYREAVIGEERDGRWPAWSRGAGDASGGRVP